MIYSPDPGHGTAHPDMAFARAEAGYLDGPMAIEMSALINALPSPVAVLDRRGDIVAVSEAWKRFALAKRGVSLADCSVGQNYLELCRLASGPTAKAAHEVYQAIHAILCGEKSQLTVEYPYQIADEQRWVSLQAVPTWPGMQGAVIEQVDVTAGKRAEAERDQLRARDRSARSLADHQRQEAELARAQTENYAHKLEAALDAVSDAVYLCNASGHVVHANRTFQELIGRTAYGGFMAMRPRERAELLHVRDRHGESISVDELPDVRALRGELVEGAHAVNLCVRLSNGHDAQADVAAAPLRDDKGNVVGAVTAFRAVTECAPGEREAVERSCEPRDVGGDSTNSTLAFEELRCGLPTSTACSELPCFDQPTPPMGTTRPGHQWRDDVSIRTSGSDGTAPRLDGHRRLAIVSTALGDATPVLVIGGVVDLRAAMKHRLVDLRIIKSWEALLAIVRVLVAMPNSDDVVKPDADATASRLTELARSAFGCRCVSVSSVEPETELLRPLARAGWLSKTELARFAEGRASSLCELVPDTLVRRLRAGEVVVRECAHASNTGTKSGSARGLAVAPLLVGKQLFGVMVLDFGRRRHSRTAQDLELIGAIGQLAAVALERQRLLGERASARSHEQALGEATHRMELFMAMASHEVRTPLAVIKSYLSGAEQQMASYLEQAGDTHADIQVLTTVRQAVQTARRAALQIGGLIDDLLQVSRARAGKVIMHPQRCDLTTLVRQTVQEQQQVQPERRLGIHLRRNQRLPVDVDPDRIRQVLTNFLDNARKYSPEDRPVDVFVTVTGGMVSVAVRDRGPGLPREEQARIWDCFYQAAEVQHRPSERAGLGLGLYMSRLIVDQHGGHVGMESELGRGSTFWFTLPLADASRAWPAADI
jgi:signal transduction histidine kinase/PAS domain-containing protein